MTQARRAGARIFVFDYRLGMEMAVRANGGRYASLNAGQPTGLNPLWTETDARGTAWLSDWLATLLYRADKPLTPCADQPHPGSRAPERPGLQSGPAELAGFRIAFCVHR